MPFPALGRALSAQVKRGGLAPPTTALLSSLGERGEGQPGETTSAGVFIHPKARTDASRGRTAVLCRTGEHR